jgi:hypothetical protein
MVVLGPDASLLVLAGPLLTIGIGFGISNGILDAAAATSVPPARAGMAVGMFNTTRIAGEVVAIAVVGSMIVGFLRGMLPASVQGWVDGTGALANRIAEGSLATAADAVAPRLVDAFVSTATDAYTAAMQAVLLVLAVICLVMVPVLAVLMRSRPAVGSDTPTPAQSDEVLTGA